MLDYASSERRAPKVFLGLRDVIGKPRSVRAAWEQLGAYETSVPTRPSSYYGDRAVYDDDRSERTCVARPRDRVLQLRLPATGRDRFRQPAGVGHWC